MWRFFTRILAFPLIEFVAHQLEVDIEEFEIYQESRANTKHDHLIEIKKYYKYKNFNYNRQVEFTEKIYEKAKESTHTERLMNYLIVMIRQNNILLPGISTLERMIVEVILKAENEVIETYYNTLSFEQQCDLIKVVNEKKNYYNILTWLKDFHGKNSPNTLNELMEKLDYIREFRLEIESDKIHPNMRRKFIKIALKLEPISIRRMIDGRKKVVFLALALKELEGIITDKIMEIHDKQMIRLISRGKRKQEEEQKENFQKSSLTLKDYVELGEIIIKADIENKDIAKEIHDNISIDKLKESINEAKNLINPESQDYLKNIKNQYTHIRKYTPKFLSSFDFSTNSDHFETKQLLEAIDIIKDSNNQKTRVLNSDIPVDFIPKKWKKYLYTKEGKINKNYYEMATLYVLNNKLKSGDTAVKGSKNYINFSDHLFTDEEWSDYKKKVNIGIEVNEFEEYINDRKKELEKRIKYLSKNYKNIEGLNISDGKISLERLEKAVPEESDSFNERVYRLMPRIKFPEMLLEVEQDTNFIKHLRHASTFNSPKIRERSTVLATLMALGINIGLSKMEYSTPEITYSQMANVSHWRLHEDALKNCNAALVNYYHKMHIPKFWGDGTTSSSDATRLIIGASSLNADFNPHFGIKKGASIYRHISDQYSAFYTKIINTNSRDALHVLDGLLYHDTELNICEHYTDTAGYTDQVFGLSHLLGFKFEPRIRDISDLILYKFDKTERNKNVDMLFKGKINENIIKNNFDDILKLVGSIKEGKVTASTIMSKLASYSRQNTLSKALREIGRIEKTIFLLDYITDKERRRKVQIGLNKGESVNALARIIFFGKSGELKDRSIQGQLQKASVLSILINIIAIWNAKYLGLVIDYMRENEEFDESLLEHLSPLGSSHINFLGDYNFKNNILKKETGARKLNIKNP